MKSESAGSKAAPAAPNEETDVLVIGGGPAGMAAAIAAARSGARAMIAERMDRVGVKLLATGSGRCNLSNMSIYAERYHGSSVSGAFGILAAYGCEFAADFFGGLGVLTAVEGGGRVYPKTRQASTVLDALRAELAYLGARELVGREAVSIEARGGRFRVGFSSGGHVAARKVIVAAGGMASAFLGSNGSGCALLERLGHRLAAPAPALVQIRLQAGGIKGLTGLRANARASLVREGAGGARDGGASGCRHNSAGGAQDSGAGGRRGSAVGGCRNGGADAGAGEYWRCEAGNKRDGGKGGYISNGADSCRNSSAGSERHGAAKTPKTAAAAVSAAAEAVSATAVAGTASAAGTAASESAPDVLYEETGEVLFTDYGISGIPILNLSNFLAPHISAAAASGVLRASDAANGGRPGPSAGTDSSAGRRPPSAAPLPAGSRAAGWSLRAAPLSAGFALYLDLFPEFGESELLALLRRRISERGGHSLEQILSGWINKRFVRPIVERAGAMERSPLAAMAARAPASSLDGRTVALVARAMKSWRHEIVGVMGFDSAQVTYGGLLLDDFHVGTLESKIVPGLYAAGEILDIAGDCGGYNLHWAWASGYAAGQSAAASLRGA
jgi:predicted flavoprotein YhiN